MGLTITWFAIILALMAPVPWARWFNFDHTLNQTLVSLVLGTCVGAGAFYCRVRFFSDPWKPWDNNSDHMAMPKIVPSWAPPWITTRAPSHEHIHTTLIK